MRLEYIVRQVLEEWLGLCVHFHRDVSTYRKASLPKVNYSDRRLLAEEVFIPDSGFLFERGLRAFTPAVLSFPDVPSCLFPLDRKGADFPGDIFALCFFLLSRYEEYPDGERDDHGRFPSERSLAFRHDFLGIPLVDQWVKRLSETLEARFPQLEIRKSRYRFLPTYDIDYAWAYRHKSLFRHLPGAGKDLILGNRRALHQRLQVVRGKARDPFDRFEYLERLHRKHKLDPLFFFLLADYGKYDKNISWKSEAMHSLVQRLSKEGDIGLHPSYYSTPCGELMSKEKLRLEVMSGEKVLRSRQHFLRLHLPHTYRNLIENGILEDYTMGYPDRPGFRASTSRPFHWYDLQREQITGLMIHPFQVMDGSLKNYMGLKPEQAVEAVRPLIKATREVEGTFITLWHNSSFSAIGGWEKWGDVYEALVSEASDTSGKDV